jgi:TonB family protein
MLRLLIALLVSLVLHALLLANLYLPMSEVQDWSLTRIHLADAQIAEVEEVAPEQPQIEPEIPNSAERSFVQPSAPVNDSDVDENSEEPAEAQPDIGDGGQSEMEPAETGEGDVPGVSTGLVDEVDNGGDVEAEESDGDSADAADPNVDEVEESGAVDSEAILAGYRSAVLAAIDAHKVYPPVARRLGQEGDVRVRFRVSSDGEVSSVEIETSSGVTSLDEAAREAVLSASPVSPIPPELQHDSLTLSLLIIFSLD